MNATALILTLVVVAWGASHKVNEVNAQLGGIGPARVSFRTPFTVVTSVRELPDGRVIVGDERENTLSIADPRVGTADPIGRIGRGPGEFTQVARVFASGADTSYMKDPFALRWLVLIGEHPQRGSATDIVVDGAGAMRDRPVGVDRASNIFLTSFARGSAGRVALQDSVLLLRVQKGRRRADTVALLRPEVTASLAEPTEQSRGSQGSALRRYSLGLIVKDAVTVFPDGWVAIVRASPYRVDWCPPTLPCRVGKILAPERQLTETAKRAYFSELSALSGDLQTNDVQRTVGWPSFIPAFIVPFGRMDATVAHAAPDGQVVIERVPTSPSNFVSYDVVNRNSQVTSQVTLPVTQRIVGFGRSGVYVVRADADKLQWLSRHDWR